MGDQFEMKGLYTFKDQSAGDDGCSKRTKVLLGILAGLHVLTLGGVLGSLFLTMQNHKEISMDILELKTEVQQRVMASSARRVSDKLHSERDDIATPTAESPAYGSEPLQKLTSELSDAWKTIEGQFNDLVIDVDKQLAHINSLVSDGAVSVNMTRTDRMVECIDRWNITADLGRVIDKIETSMTVNSNTLHEAKLNFTSHAKDRNTDCVCRVENDVLERLTNNTRTMLLGDIENSVIVPAAEILKLVNESTFIIKNIHNITVADAESNKQVMEHQIELKHQLSSMEMSQSNLTGEIKQSNTALKASVTKVCDNSRADISIANSLERLENNTHTTDTLVQATVAILEKNHDQVLNVLNRTARGTEHLILNGNKQLNTTVALVSGEQVVAINTTLQQVHSTLEKMSTTFTDLHSNVVETLNDASENVNETINSLSSRLTSKTDLENFRLRFNSSLVTGLKTMDDLIRDNLDDLNANLTKNNAVFLKTINDNKNEMTLIITQEVSTIEAYIDQLESVVRNYSATQVESGSSDQIHADVGDILTDVRNKLADLSHDIRNVSGNVMFQDDKSAQMVNLPDMMSSLYNKFHYANILAYTRNLSLVETSNSAADSNLSILEKGNSRINNMEVVTTGNNVVVQGRIEVYAQGVWGTVCDDKFDNTDASVACRSLGFRQGTARGSAAFGRGVGRILLDDLGCSGNEENLFACQHIGIGSHNCGHSEDSGVVCS